MISNVSLFNEVQSTKIHRQNAMNGFVFKSAPPAPPKQTGSPDSARDVWDSQFKEQFDSLDIDPAFQDNVRNLLQNKTPANAQDIIDRMKKYLAMPPGNIGEAKIENVGNTREYTNWMANWTQSLNNWLGSQEAEGNPGAREQGHIAKAFLESLIEEQGSTTTAGVAGADAVFDGILFKKLGRKEGESEADFFERIFSDPNGAADFSKGVHDTRFNAKIKEGENGKMEWVNQKVQRPGAEMPPYCMMQDPETSEWIPTYNGCAAYMAASYEAMGMDFKLDCNNVPITSGQQIGNQYAYKMFGLWGDSIANATYEKPERIELDDPFGDTYQTNAVMNDTLHSLLDSLYDKLLANPDLDKETVENYTDSMRKYTDRTYRLASDDFQKLVTGKYEAYGKLFPLSQLNEK